MPDPNGEIQDVKPDFASLMLGMFLPPEREMKPFLETLSPVPVAAVRLGDMALVNVPGDLSREISVVWKQWAARHELDLWTSGFSGEYAYETGFMSMAGPHHEAFLAAQMQRVVPHLAPITAK
jgi:hypothetical protein